jgi:hypothetical protein
MTQKQPGSELFAQCHTIGKYGGAVIGKIHGAHNFLGLDSHVTSFANLLVVFDKTSKGYGSIRHQAKLRSEKGGRGKKWCGD